MKSSRWHLDEMLVRINGEMHYLWRTVDHEGDTLESYVTKTRDKKAALKFLGKAMRKHGRCDRPITDKLRRRCPAPKTATKRGADSTTGWRMRTCRSDDGSVRCFGFAGCDAFRCSPPSTPPFQTTSTRSAAFRADISSN